MLLAPGYLLAYALNLCGFRRLRLPERLLWSIALSNPLAVLASVYGGLIVGNQGVGIAFLLLPIAVVWVHRKKRFTTSSEKRLNDRPLQILVVTAGVVSTYLLVAGSGIVIRDRLFEGVASCDWGVRAPLIASAIRTGMPLVNPFYAVDGVVGPLRYYFYWYALCGVVGRTFSLPARAVLQAGALWAGLLMFSTLFLLLKYLFVPAREWAPRRWVVVCVGCVCAMPVLGLDVLQAIYAELVAKQLMPEIEWWRAAAGFAPSFHTFFLYAPHHTFGVCAGFTGFLVLLLPRVTNGGESSSSRTRMLALAIVAGLCFGAMVGTSTYVAMFFTLACILVGVERVVRRDWWMVLCICLSGLVAVLGAWDCIHVILGNPSHGGGGAFVKLHVRGLVPVVDWYRSQFTQHGLAVQPRWVRWGVQAVLYIALELAEAGVFIFVLVHRMRTDLFSRARLSPEQMFQWLLVTSFFFFAFFVTSEGTIPSNDLGFHAGFVLRIVAVLWSAPWIVSLWKDADERRRLLHSWGGKFAAAMIFIGLGTQLWQVVGQRVALMSPAWMHRLDGPFPSPPHLGQKYYDVYQAWQAADKLLPQDAFVLTNPDSTQRTMGTLYANRQLIAPEPKCMAAFGGSATACTEELPALRRVFGESPDGTAENTAEEVANPSALDEVCRRNKASAVLVSQDDPVWSRPQSWVWSESPTYANSRERLYSCEQVKR